METTAQNVIISEFKREIARIDDSILEELEGMSNPGKLARLYGERIAYYRAIEITKGTKDARSRRGPRMKVKLLRGPSEATAMGGTEEEYQVGYLKGDFLVKVYHLGAQKRRSYLIHNLRTSQEVREGLLLFQKITEGMDKYLAGDREGMEVA